MIGAIIGDIVGSRFEFHPASQRDFTLFHPACHFTDDTVLTIAVAYAILHQQDYGVSIKAFGRRYPKAGYGGSFRRWLASEDSAPYRSWGNGSAMRVSPVGFAFNSVERVLSEAAASAACTHNHPEGIKGAQSVALAILRARNGWSKADIKAEISERFGYDLARRLDDIQPDYSFDVSCQGSVPESIIAFLESDSYESAICNAIWLDGDADTMACIAGGIAQAFYGEVAAESVVLAQAYLPEEFRQVISDFDQACKNGSSFAL
ncbi:MAG: ADP-ribosylglycohydrolase family protein [Gammaproteobacteria bacterium]|nr:ADP-ribosylglycohydrolase family protein [Gammaproteobacteria bacterium]